MKILVGSTNPVKIAAVDAAFSQYFEDIVVEGVAVTSEVPDQPINEETFEGAFNRANSLKDVNDAESLGAEFFVGIEGGIIELDGKWFAFGVMCVMDRNGKVGYGTSGHFPIPPSMTERLLSGEEMGIITDEVTGENNTKHGQGAVGFLSKGAITRTDFYVPGVIFALIPFLNEELYRSEA